MFAVGAFVDEIGSDGFRGLSATLMKMALTKNARSADGQLRAINTLLRMTGEALSLLEDSAVVDAANDSLCFAETYNHSVDVFDGGVGDRQAHAS